MRRSTWRRVGTAALAVVALAALVGVAWARPGGGNSYSGGGGHGGSSSGSGGGGGGAALLELVFHLVRLVFVVPQIGVPILLLIVGYIIWSAYQQHQNRDWNSGPAAPLARAASLDDLRTLDPDFSQAAFEDFAFRLYSTAHRARGTAHGLDAVAPYVSEAARAALRAQPPTASGDAPIHGVVVGAMRVIRVTIPPPPPADATPTDDALPPLVELAIEFEANVMAGAGAAHKTYFNVERWYLRRGRDVRSKPPGVSRTLACPNCGAPWQADNTGSQRCTYCSQVVDNGRFDWLVSRVELLASSERPPSLTQDVPERGTDLPTYMQAGFAGRWASLLAEDPALEQGAVQARVQYVFDEIARGWAARDLSSSRAVISDGLYDVFAYWIDAYRQQGLRNVLDRLRITRMVPCKLVRDRWYDALTVRVWGTGLDYVVREPGGDVVKGSRHTERAYSEYWTFVRSSERRGATRADASCGNCGAPMKITQAGACEHCGAHVTAGEFDWVLSKIEQDDSYRG